MMLGPSRQESFFRSMRAIPPRCYPDALPREQSHAPPRDEARAVARGDDRTMYRTM